MDIIEKIHDAIKAYEQTEDVIFVRTDYSLNRGDITDVNVWAIVCKSREKKKYLLRLDLLKDGFEVKHTDKWI